MFPGLKQEEYTGTTGKSEEITLVALSYCEHCHEAIAFLKEEGVSFSYLFLDTLPHAQRGPLLRQLKERTNNDLVFPVLLTPTTLLKGFDPEVWRDAIT
jgi:glutaredoxin